MFSYDLIYIALSSLSPSKNKYLHYDYIHIKTYERIVLEQICVKFLMLYILVLKSF